MKLQNKLLYNLIYLNFKYGFPVGVHRNNLHIKTGCATIQALTFQFLIALGCY